MGTRGYFSYAYKGKTYAHYSCGDSWAYSLGVRLVRSIPSDPEEYKKWYADKCRELDQVDEDAEPYCNCYEIECEKHYEVMDYPPALDLWIEWTYVIDLDFQAFTVDNAVYFRLDKLPRGPDNTEWINYLELDATYYRCILPSTPREYLLDIHERVHDLFPDRNRARDVYNSIARGITTIERDTWRRMTSSRPVLNDLAFFAFKGLVEESYGLFYRLHAYGAKTNWFQYHARVLLTAAAPGILHVTEEDASRDRRWIVPSKSSNMTFADHIKSEDGDASGLFYWFRNCLIVFSSRLDDEVWLECWIGMTVERIRAGHSGRSSCTAILWSVRHAVAIVVSDTRVSRSPLIPVIETFGVDDDAFVEAVDFLTHFLAPSVINAGTSESEFSPGANSTASIDATEPRLPFDIVTHILDFADVNTYNTSAIWSKAYRINWARCPRVGRFKLFKSRHATDINDTYEHPFRALPCRNSITSTLCNMHLFHADFDFQGWGNDSEPGTRLYFHIPWTCAGGWWRDFTLLNVTDSKRSTCFIIPEENMDECGEKYSFNHSFETIAFERSNYGTTL